MKMAKLLKEMTMPELEMIRVLANFDSEENEIFDLLARGSSIVAIADRLNISQATVSNRIKVIRKKIDKVVSFVER